MAQLLAQLAVLVTALASLVVALKGRGDATATQAMLAEHQAIVMPAIRKIESSVDDGNAATLKAINGHARMEHGQDHSPLQSEPGK